MVGPATIIVHGEASADAREASQIGGVVVAAALSLSQIGAEHGDQLRSKQLVDAEMVTGAAVLQQIWSAFWKT
jgi:hypothetical protein